MGGRWWPQDGALTPEPLAVKLESPGFDEGVLWSLASDGTGRYLISHYGWAQLTFDGQRWTSLPTPEEMHSAIFDLNADASRLWTLHGRGVGYFEYSRANGLGAYVDLSSEIHAQRGNQMWMPAGIVGQREAAVLSLDEEVWFVREGQAQRLSERARGRVDLVKYEDTGYWFFGGLRLGILQDDRWMLEPYLFEDSETSADRPRAWEYPVSRLGRWEREGDTLILRPRQNPELAEGARFHPSANVNVEETEFFLGTYEHGLWVYRDREPIWEAKRFGERTEALHWDEQENLLVGGASLNLWQKPGQVWDWTREGMSDGWRFSSPQGPQFVFHNFAAELDPRTGALNPNDDLVYGYYSFGTAGFWKSISAHSVNWEDASDWSGEISLEEDQVQQIHALDASGRRLLVVGRVHWYLAEAKATGEVSLKTVRAADGFAYGFRAFGGQTWAMNEFQECLRFVVTADGKIEQWRQQRIDPGRETSGYQLFEWNGVLLAAALKAPGIYLWNPLRSAWERQRHFDHLLVDTFEEHTDGSVTLAVQSVDASLGELPPFLVTLKAEAGGLENPQYRWIGADLGIRRIGMLHFDTAHRRWWIGGGGRFFSVEAGVLRSFSEVPEVHVSSTEKIGATGSLAERAYDAPSIGFSWRMANWMENPPFATEIRLAGGPNQRWERMEDARIQYSGLREGRYALETRLRDPQGVTHLGPTVAFRILPPWYRSPGAYGVYGVMLIGMLYLGLQLYTLRQKILREHLERMVKQRTAELEEANAAKSEFVANMSHELRNPMNGVIGLSELLSRSELSKEQRSYVRTLRACAEQLGQMIGDVLDFAKIEAGRMRLEKRPFGLRAMLDKTMEVASWDATQSSHQIHLQITGELPTLAYSDDRKLTQILTNFLSNACKYSEVGDIYFLVRCQPIVRNRVLVRFEVDDAGPGLTAEERAKVFDRFYRSPRAIHTQVRGSGLGLAVAQEMASLLGAKIGVEGNARGGSTFFLELALALPEGMNAHELPPNFDTEYVGSVLVVDDMDYNRLVVAGLLETLGFSVTSVSSGTEAIQCLLAAEYDFAFIDFDLGDLTGPQIVEESRRERPKMKTRFFALTAYVSEAKRKACEAVGMIGFVSKPVSREKMREALLSSGLDEAVLRKGTYAADRPEPTPLCDLEGLLLLARGDKNKLTEKAEDYLRLLQAELEPLRRLVREANPGEVPALRKRLHRLLSHAGILRAGPLMVAIEHLQKTVTTEPVPQWEDALETLEEAASELAVNLRRSVEAYRSVG